MAFQWRPGVKGLSSDIASSLCRLGSESFSSQNETWRLNVSASLDKDKYEILNNPEEMLEGLKESENAPPKFIRKIKYYVKI